MKRFIILLTLFVSVGFAFALEYTPKQMIFKTSEPIQITRGQTGLTQFDQFLRNYQPQNIKPLTPKADNRYFTATLNVDPDWVTLQAARPHFPGIEYIQPNYLNQFYLTPNDPFYGNQQLYLDHIPEAWDIATGTHQTIIGLIDSGLLFDHPDLQTNIYINPGEIPNNGIDDDNNGYVDDWRGWDFADAPELSDIGLGDYVGQDNDPTDENFHGTHVGGIMCADTNNGIGIAGINWNCRLMVMRAGFRTTEGSGYLQDDDASSAIIYAADMGCEVVNMSWGDTNYSPIIADACQYAYDKGLILVASAGNSPEPVLSYPARLSTVISVGAVDINKNLAGFSSFGPDLDLVAPGQDIYSTYQSSGADLYKNQSGTSMSSPFVTASIGLLLSNQPGLSFEQVRSRLLMSCDDLGASGFDISYGNGLLNTYNFLSNTSSPQIVISQPLDHEGLSAEFDIVGTATSPNFWRYSVMFTDADVPTDLDWLDVQNHNNTPHFYYTQVTDSVLAHFHFPPAFGDGNYKIRVEITNTNGYKYSYTRAIRIDRTPPLLIAGSLQPWLRYDAENMNYYIQSMFNEDVDLTVYCMTSIGDIYEAYSVTADTLQIVKLPETLPEGMISVQLHAVNHSGLIYDSPWYNNFMELHYDSITGNGFTSVLLGPPLVTSYTVRDFNHDGNYEFIGMKLPDAGYGDVNIYQLNSSSFLNEHLFYDKFWPLDIGNTLGSGTEVLGLYLDTAFLYETPDSMSYPNNFALWHDTGISGGTFADYDNNGVQDLILVKNLPSQRVLQLYRRNPNATSEQSAFDARNMLTNTTTTFSRNTFVPKVCVANLDGDIYPDILSADTDGDVMIFEVSSPSLQAMTWSTRLPVQNAYYLTVGDFNGDGQKDFAVGGYNKDLINPNKTFWYFGFFTANGGNNYVSMGNISFTTVSSQNSISCLDVNNDGKDEILMALSPNMYIVSYVNGKFVPIWHGESYKTYQLLAYKDLNSSNIHMIVNNLDERDSLHCYEIKPTSAFNGPQTPENVRVTPLNENTVKITWKQVDADYYKIYRKYNSVVTFVNSTTSLSYLDNSLQEGETYEFAVTSVKLGMDPQESSLSQWKQAIPNPAPHLTFIGMTAFNEVKLVFDQPLASEAINVGHYLVEPGMGNPYSAILISSQHGVLLRFRSTFPDTLLTVQLSGLTGVTGVPVEMTVYPFGYRSDCIAPEISNVRVIDQRTLEVVFSEKLDAESASSISNYQLLAPVADSTNHIQTIEFQDSVATIKLVRNMTYSNDPYLLIISNVQDLQGNVISNLHNKSRFFVSDIRDLTHLIVYPNPANARETGSVYFINFPMNKEGKIKIYNLAGEFVYEAAIPAINSHSYKLHWDMVNSAGKKVSSGTYFYMIQMGGELKKGKIAIVR
ncbi:MAG TPA: S8 family serine peptidase [Candidatus Cloacimonadota bacterium]|nr:S8 family serine peptidase [Candidatus Cloacimonadota bacterium]